MNKDERYYEIYKMVMNNDFLTYKDVVLNAKPNSPKDVEQFERKNDEFVDELNKYNIPTWLQENDSGKKSNFRHIKLGNANEYKYRIYLCPQLKNLHSIIKMLLSRNRYNNIHLKYSTDMRRTDRLIMYLQEQKDVEKQEEILKQMRIEKPELFENMERALSWIHESPKNKDIYIEKEPKLSGTSYSKQFVKAVTNAITIAQWGTKNIHEATYQIFKKTLDNQLNQRGIGEIDIPLTEHRVFVNNINLCTELPLNNTFSKYRVYKPEKCEEYLNNINKSEKMENIETYVVERKKVNNWLLYPKNRSSSLQEYLLVHKQDESIVKDILVEKIRKAQEEGKELEAQIKAKSHKKDERE